MSLTPLQAQVLGCIREYGPADAAEVDRNLLIGIDSARGALARLERRGLLEPQYTGHRHHGRAFVISDTGEVEYQKVWGVEDDG